MAFKLSPSTKKTLREYAPYVGGGVLAAWLFVPSVAKAMTAAQERAYVRESSQRPEFYRALVAMSRGFGVDPREVIRVMVAESGVDPSAVNKSSGAKGLIQIMPSTAKGIMTDGEFERLDSMTGAEQMPYVARYFASVGLSRGSNRGEIYRKVFLPFANVGPNGELTYKGQSAYDNNETLDVNGDGVITIDDLSNKTNYALSAAVLDGIAQAEQQG